MGLGATLPLAGGFISQLLALLQGERATQTAVGATRPGRLPGTLGEGESYSGPWGISSLDNNPYVDEPRVTEMARLDPRIPGLLGFGASMERNVRPLAERLSGQLGGLGDQTADLRDRTRAAFDRSGEARDQRRASLGTTSTDLTNRTKALNEDVSGRLRRIADDPTIVTQDEVNAIAGNILARTSAEYGAANEAAQADAARRGRSVDAVNSTQAVLSQMQENAGAQSLRDVILANAAARGQRQLAATGALGEIGGSLLGLESDIGAKFGALDIGLIQAAEEAAARQAAIESGLLGQEGGFRTASMQPLMSLEEALAQIPLAMGEVGAQRGDYNTLLASGAYNAASDRLSNVGSALLNMGFGRMNAREARDAAGSGGLFGSAGDIGQLGFLGSAAFGTATGQPQELILADLLMSQGFGGL